MSAICWLLGHEPGDAGLWNEGYFFSHCARCHADLIRTDGHWAPVPHGYQVSWKSGVHRHAIASDFKRNLPLAPDEPRRWKLALHRIGLGVLLLPGPRPQIAEREASGGLPQMVLLGLLTALGLAGRLVAHRR